MNTIQLNERNWARRQKKDKLRKAEAVIVLPVKENSPKFYNKPGIF